ncbi:unnamed protein product [Alopecurus aequalis]
MASGSSQLSMKLLLDTHSQRVVYAEAGKDVVVFLFNLLNLPISSVVKLLTTDSDISMVGSLGDLYRSVEKLDDTYICHDNANAVKDALLRPTAGCQSGKLLFLTDASSNGRCYTNRGGYVEGIVTYMVMDNLKVTPMSTISALTTLLNNTGVRDTCSLREKTVRIGHTEGLEILKASLESKTVLTDVFLGRNCRRA